MRPIDADALMEKLNGIWDCNDMTFAPVDGCYIDADCKSCRWRETIEYVKRLVQNQATITISTWHRVEEPPDIDEYVLAFDGDIVVMASFDGEKWWQHDTYESFTISPSYWMPLPGLPKEE